MTEQALRGVSAGLAAVGAALTVHLLYVRHTGSTLACTTGGCEAVQSSRYAEMFGVPVAALGLAAYASIFAAAVARGERARLVQAAVALSAVIFSGYLLVVQLRVIDALCDWCLASDLVTTALAAAALLRLRAAGCRGGDVPYTGSHARAD